MGALYGTRLRYCMLSPVPYLVLCCLVLNTGTHATPSEDDSCKEPDQRFIVFKALKAVFTNQELKKYVYVPPPQDGWYTVNTTIFLECQSAATKTFTTMHKGSLRFTCVKPNDSSLATWDSSFPECSTQNDHADKKLLNPALICLSSQCLLVAR